MQGKTGDSANAQSEATINMIIAIILSMVLVMPVVSIEKLMAITITTIATRATNPNHTYEAQREK